MLIDMRSQSTGHDWRHHAITKRHGSRMLARSHNVLHFKGSVACIGHHVGLLRYVGVSVRIIMIARLWRRSMRRRGYEGVSGALCHVRTTLSIISVRVIRYHRAAWRIL